MAVIGTLLALLVFFALFGIFLTQYVPIWMTDNEAAFTSAAGTSFLEFKSAVDTQYTLGGPPVLGTPFTLSSQGIPLIAQPTQGSLTFLPSTCPQGFYLKGTPGATSANYGQPVDPGYCIFENQTISIGPGGSSALSLRDSSGVLEMLLPNRYYSSELFYYEDDGVIQAQSQGYQIMAFSPPFNVTAFAGNTTVTTSFLEQFGNATTVIAQGSQSVYSHLRFSQLITSNGRPTAPSFVYSYEIGTQYPCAWSQFLRAQMNVSGLPATQYNWTNPVTHAATVPYTGSCYNPTGVTTVIALNVKTVNYATIFYAGVEVTMGVGSA